VLIPILKAYWITKHFKCYFNVRQDRKPALLNGDRSYKSSFAWNIIEDTKTAAVCGNMAETRLFTVTATAAYLIKNKKNYPPLQRYLLYMRVSLKLNECIITASCYEQTYANLTFVGPCILTFKRRIKSHLAFAGIIRSSPYSPRFQDNG